MRYKEHEFGARIHFINDVNFLSLSFRENTYSIKHWYLGRTELGRKVVYGKDAGCQGC